MKKIILLLSLVVATSMARGQFYTGLGISIFSHSKVLKNEGGGSIGTQKEYLMAANANAGYQIRDIVVHKSLTVFELNCRILNNPSCVGARGGIGYEINPKFNIVGFVGGCYVGKNKESNTLGHWCPTIGARLVVWKYFYFDISKIEKTNTSLGFIYLFNKRSDD